MSQTRQEFIDSILTLPQRLAKLTAQMTDAQLDTPYRKGGWTVRQVVHHLVDSHTNGYVRIKLMLAEEHPTLRLYNQEVWAEFDDVKIMPIESSLKILDGLHERLAYIFEHASESDYKRTAYHPEVGDVTLEYELENYATHGENHLKQITGLF